MKKPAKTSAQYQILIEAHRHIGELNRTIKEKEHEIRTLKKRLFELNAEFDDKINRIIKYVENLDTGNGQKLKVDKQKALGYEPLNDIAYGIGDKK